MARSQRHVRDADRVGAGAMRASGAGYAARGLRRRLPAMFPLVGVFVLAGAFAAQASPLDGSSGWSITRSPNPKAPTGQLLSGTCTSTSSCMAVGAYETSSKLQVTLAERWNGRRWHIQPTPNPAGARVSALFGVSCAGPSACTAVGSAVMGSGREVTLVERWNGRTWRIEPSPNPGGRPQSVLGAVSCPSPSSCTAVGGSVTSSGTQLTLAERWNGGRWRIVRTPNPPGGQVFLPGLADVVCPSLSSCIAVGGSSQGTLAEEWNGHGWRIEPTPNPRGGGALSGVACSSSSRCTAVGGSAAGTLAVRWNGARWRIQPTPNPSQGGASLSGVDCSSSGCTAVGGAAAGTLAERWNGHRWAIQRTPSPGGAQGDVLGAVACPRQHTCIAFGSSHGSGTPLTMAQQWNGKGWHVQRTANPTGAAETQLNSVSCTSRASCIAVGYTGPTIGVTSAIAERWDGTTWRLQPTPTIAGANLNAVSCSSPSACIAVGVAFDTSGNPVGTITERWDGMSWSIQSTPTSGSAGSFLNAVSCSSPSVCTAVGQNSAGQVLAERWDGTSWSIQPVPAPAGAPRSFLTGVSCASATACTAVGGVGDSTGQNSLGTVAEQWNGTTWSIQGSPTTQSPGYFLNALSCTSASACTAVGNTASMNTLAERWNGTSWTVQPTPSPVGAMGLSGVACSAPSACTAVGLTSTNLGGTVLAERWNGTKWQVQHTPLIPALSTRTSSAPAVACTASATCTVVGGYEAPGPTSVTLAEQWSGTA